MTNKEYNGWTNYETWVVNLWIDNDQGSQEYWSNQAQEAWDHTEATHYSTRQQNTVSVLANQLKDEFDEAECNLLDSAKAPASVWADLLNAALSEVNWHEIAEHYVENVADKEQPAND